MVQFCLTLSVIEGTRFRFLWGYRNSSEQGMKVPCLPFLRGVSFASYESPVASPLPVRSGWFSSYNRRIRTQAPVAYAPGSLKAQSILDGHLEMQIVNGIPLGALGWRGPKVSRLTLHLVTEWLAGQRIIGNRHREIAQ